ncbi:MAG: hypothetical protein R3E68_05605 [Burkholderiaceae bacterium]
MSSLDAIWWLLLGALSGWLGLWAADKFLYRDGELAGIRAGRELEEVQSLLGNSRAMLETEQGRNRDLQETIAGAQDQVAALKGEVAMISNERTAVQESLGSAQLRLTAVQADLEGARRLGEERAEEARLLKQQIHEFETGRAAAESWAQAKDNEVAELRAELTALRAEREHLEEQLGMLRPAHQSQAEELAALRTRAETLSANLDRANGLLKGVGHDILRAQRNMRELQWRMRRRSRSVPMLQKRLRQRMSQLEATRQNIDAFAQPSGVAAAPGQGSAPGGSQDD